jgi:hypothetical protein
VAPEIDHVVLPVRDLAVAAEELRTVHGLASLAGGRHHGHGTANRIVPLGGAYLELLAVVDRDEAAASPMGRWVLERLAGAERSAALCLRADDLDAVCRRLGLAPVAMRRIRPDGVVLAWRLAGLEAAFTRGVPFFISWEVPAERHPGAATAAHRVPVEGIAWVEVGGDRAELAAWIGSDDVPLRVVEGPTGVRRVAVATTSGILLL